MIQLASLSKSFGDRVLLDAVSWQIDDRERVGLAGPNGAGKTTLLKMLAGLEEPDAGTVVKPSALVVGYLPQDGLEHGGRSLSDEASLAFRPLLEAGIRVFEWKGPMLHAKTAVADGRWARVGSTNLNIASWFGNCELDAVIEDEPFARLMEETYLEDLENSTEVILDAKLPNVSGAQSSEPWLHWIDATPLPAGRPAAAAQPDPRRAQGCRGRRGARRGGAQGPRLSRAVPVHQATAGRR